MSAILLSITVFILTLVTACGGGSGSSGDGNQEPYIYTAPDTTDDGWQTSYLNEEGIDENKIIDMMDGILSGTYSGIDSVAIVRNNKLVHYWYDENRSLRIDDDWIRNTDRERHVLHSTSKSFTSALIGIAIDKGYIASVQVKFFDLFDYSNYLNWDSRKSDMTLEDVLTMQLGLTWDEWSTSLDNPDNDLIFIHTNSPDIAKGLLDLPMSSDSGTVFTYNTAATIAIGQALENSTTIPMAEFANTYLFNPMQIYDADWGVTATQLPNGGSALFLKTRDTIKLGQLYLDGGLWNNQRLISSTWVNASITRHVDLSEDSRVVHATKGYGYQWWIDELNYKDQPLEIWSTKGFGGQYMFVVPALELVVAFTSHNYSNRPGVDNLYLLMEQYILDAIDD